MEAQFVYEVLKEMHKSEEGSFFGKGSGSDTYASMFDMEVAQQVAKRGIGLQDVILKGMMKYEKKSEEAHAKAEAAKAAKAAGADVTLPAPPAPAAPRPNTIDHTINGPTKLYNLSEIKNNHPYALNALKFSGTSADKSLEKLSRR